MKHLLFTVLFIAVAVLMFGRPLIQANLGIDFPGTLKASGDGSGDTDTKMGISPSLEALFPIQSVPNLLVGGGVEYQLQRKLDEDNIGDAAFGFVPIYATAKYAFMPESNIHPEGIVNLGYDFLTGNDDFKAGTDLSGGFCYGIGVGISTPQGFVASLMYRGFNGSMDGDIYGYSYTIDLTQTNLTLSLGYRF